MAELLGSSLVCGRDQRARYLWFVFPFERLDATTWPYLIDEPGGASKKHWIANPADSTSWLFKSVKVHKNGTRSTSDLSEVIAFRVAQSIGLPAATYALARIGEEEGSISRDLALPGYELDEGWKWIRGNHGSLIPSMLRGTDEKPINPSPDYGYENLHKCLGSLSPPPGYATFIDGYTLFCGYLLLDAIIANTDRHEANWAVFRAPSGSGNLDMLAPTFDHGASLGQQLPESKKADILLSSGGIEAWCRKGMAKRFSLAPDGSQESLVDYFVRASRLADPIAIQGWVSAVRSSLTGVALEDLVPSISGMSEVPVRFALKVIEENVRRVLNEF